MAKKSIIEMAKELDLAALRGKPIPRFTKSQEFSLQEGYDVQNLLWKHQEERRARIVGYKMGMTSRAKMEQMNIRAPIHGFLTNEMEVRDGETFFFGPRIHPKVEPEIAFVLGRDLSLDATAEEVNRAIDAVALALEIIDSRYEKYDFLLPDVVADNCSSSGFVVSSTLRSARGFDYSNLGLILEVNGKPAQFGSSAAILGHPLRSLQELVQLSPKPLRAGQVVLAGGATAAVALEKGAWIRAVGEGLGTVEFRVEK